MRHLKPFKLQRRDCTLNCSESVLLYSLMTSGRALEESVSLMPHYLRLSVSLSDPVISHEDVFHQLIRTFYSFLWPFASEKRTQEKRPVILLDIRSSQPTLWAEPAALWCSEYSMCQPDCQPAKCWQGEEREREREGHKKGRGGERRRKQGAEGKLSHIKDRLHAR